VAEVHDTPDRKLSFVGFGVGTIDHFFPFHASASVNVWADTDCGWPASFPLLLPTAVQAVAEVHDTPARVLPVVPVGLGVGTKVHVVPFHASASVRFVPALSS
jgi:hypothetical protein